MNCQPTVKSPAASGRKVKMPWAQSASISIALASTRWLQETGRVTRPSTSCTHRMQRMARSVRWLVRRMRGSAMRRCRSMVSPTKQMRPAMPPDTMASNCFCGAVMSQAYRKCGVSRPTVWPNSRNRIPMWNRVLPHRSWRARSNCEESLFQVYWSRSKRARLPIRNTARQM
ncbi:hypothetical protein D9M69_537630 [compost metagenome]